MFFFYFYFIYLIHLIVLTKKIVGILGCRVTNGDRIIFYKVSAFELPGRVCSFCS